MKKSKKLLNHFVHVQINVKDIDLAVEFYSSIFSWKIKREKNWPKTALFEIGEKESDVYLEGSIQESDILPVEGNITLFIHCQDMDGLIAKIIKNGG